MFGIFHLGVARPNPLASAASIACAERAEQTTKAQLEHEEAERQRRLQVVARSHALAQRVRNVIDQRKSFFVDRGCGISPMHGQMIVAAAERNGFYTFLDPLKNRRVFLRYGADELDAVHWETLEPKAECPNTAPTAKEYKPTHGGYPG